MENFNLNKPNYKIYKVLIRIMNKLLTIDIPGDWRLSKIKKFLENNFHEQTKNSSINFIYCGKPIVLDEELAEIVKNKSEDEVHQFIVIVKPKNESELKENPKKSVASLFEANISKEDLMTKKEFLKLEKWIFDAYKDNLCQDLNKELDMNTDFLNVFPLFHQSVMSRIEIVKNSDFSHLNNITPLAIENFPIRGYLKFGLFFKLCLLFLLFAGNMKGYNFPLFVSFLVIYYWYNVKYDIEQYYQKKIEELNIKDSEIEKYDLAENESSDEEKEDTKRNDENIIEQSNVRKTPEKLENQANEETISKQINSQIDQEVEMKKIDEKALNDEKPLRKMSNLSKNSNKNKEDTKIKDSKTISRKDSKLIKKEKEYLLNQSIIKDEILPKRLCYLIFEIIITFFLSLYPNWCDDFEMRNPIIDRKKIQDNPKIEIISTKNEEENDILIENIEVIKNFVREPNNSSIDLPNENKFKIERDIVKSNTDTRKVNHDDDQTKYQLVEETENRTENEFVFSENVNIDNLSYFNEPMSEIKKKENENKLLTNNK